MIYWDVLGMLGIFAPLPVGTRSYPNVGICWECVGDVGVICFASNGGLVLSQCWDMSGFVGVVGNFGFSPSSP